MCKYANELPCVNVVLNIFRSDKYYNDVTNNNNYGSADQVKFYTIPPSKLRVNGINNPSLSTSWLVGENGVAAPDGTKFCLNPGTKYNLGVSRMCDDSVTKENTFYCHSIALDGGGEQGTSGDFENEKGHGLKWQLDLCVVCVVCMWV